MDSDRKARAFLSNGAWVPVESAVRLRDQLEMLSALIERRQPLNPHLRLLVHIHLADIDHLLHLGQGCQAWVTMERWHDAVEQLRRLTRIVASHR